MRASYFAAVVCLASLPSLAANAELSDSAIRQLIIEQSIANYPGNCPCPYFTDRAGRRCGARSAYSKRGGYAPLCFPEDVTKDMIEAFRARN